MYLVVLPGQGMGFIVRDCKEIILDTVNRLC